MVRRGIARIARIARLCAQTRGVDRSYARTPFGGGASERVMPIRPCTCERRGEGGESTALATPAAPSYSPKRRNP